MPGDYTKLPDVSGFSLSNAIGEPYGTATTGNEGEFDFSGTGGDVSLDYDPETHRYKGNDLSMYWVFWQSSTAGTWGWQRMVKVEGVWTVAATGTAEKTF